jgi:hypothetical protein
MFGVCSPSIDEVNPTILITTRCLFCIVGYWIKLY